METQFPKPEHSYIKAGDFQDNPMTLTFCGWEKKANDSTWLKQKNALPDPRNIIELKDNTGIKWLAFEGILDWEQKIPPEQEKYRHPTRRLWYMIKSYLVSKKEAADVHDWSKNQHFIGRWMPESHEFYNIFLGEYPNSPAFLFHYIPYYHHDGWTNGSNDNRIPGKILVTDDQYQSSGSSIDCSTDETINVKLAAKFIIDKMKLAQKRVDGRFYDHKGNLVAFDPVVFGVDAPRCLLFRKDKLLEFLKKYNLDIFWTVLGEKNLIGGGGMGQPLQVQEQGTHVHRAVFIPTSYHPVQGVNDHHAKRADAFPGVLEEVAQ